MSMTVQFGNRTFQNMPVFGLAFVRLVVKMNCRCLNAHTLVHFERCHFRMEMKSVDQKFNTKLINRMNIFFYYSI